MKKVTESDWNIKLVFKLGILLTFLPLNRAPVRQVVVFLERAAAAGLEGDQPRAERAPLRDGRRLHPNLQSQGETKINARSEISGSSWEKNGGIWIGSWRAMMLDISR